LIFPMVCALWMAMDSCTPRSPRTQGIWTDITASSGALPTDWHHVAVVIHETAKNLKMFVDAEVVAGASTLYLLRDLGATTQNWLGGAQHEADACFTGSIDEFRIYNRVLSEAEVCYLAGDR